MEKRHITLIISEQPGPIFTKLTHSIGIWVRIIHRIFVWRSPKGRCYGNQLNLGAVRIRCHERPLLFALTFDNEFDDREAAFKRLNGNNASTWHRNLVSLCPIISEFTLLERAIFATTWPEF